MLIDAAVVCNVNAVKLQTFKAETHISREAMFDMENTGTVSQLELLKYYAIDEGLHKEVVSYAKEKIRMVFNPFS